MSNKFAIQIFVASVYIENIAYYNKTYGGGKILQKKSAQYPNIYVSNEFVDCPSKHLQKTFIQMFHKEDLLDLKLFLCLPILQKYIQKY